MYAEINNYRMAYEDHGVGLPILFIHGYPLNRQLWAPQVQDLSRGARLVIPDLRGHGDSEEVPGPYWMDTLAGDCAALLDAIEITQPVVVCGLSMGGYVAMAFYRNFEPRVAALILAATRAGPDSPEGKANRNRAADQAQEKGVAAIVDSMLPKMLASRTYQENPELVDTVKAMMLSTSLEGVLGDLMGMRERPDSIPTLQEVLLPALVMHGAEDQIIPVAEAEAMQAALQNSKLHILPNAGHLLNLEQPRHFNEAVQNFLNNIV